MQLGDEVVGIAAVEGTGELDHAAVVEEGAAFDEKTRAAFRQAKQARLLGIEGDRAQALQRTVMGTRRTTTWALAAAVPRARCLKRPSRKSTAMSRPPSPIATTSSDSEW